MIFIFIVNFLLWNPEVSHAASRSSYTEQAERLLDAEDYLGFRVLVKKAYMVTLGYSDWAGISRLIRQNAHHVGYDLIKIWDRRNTAPKSRMDQFLEDADKLMLAKKFNEAFGIYQKVAVYIKSKKRILSTGATKGNIQGNIQGNINDELFEQFVELYPYVLQSMERALYGAHRYYEALAVINWIPSSYVYYRQVLFEKMWAAFRAGKVEVALGAIASQRSPYFSKYISPESYLLQTYIYRKLCRLDDLKQVEAEMKEYQMALDKNQMGHWFVSDPKKRVLWNLLREAAHNTSRDTSGELVSREEGEKEKRDIRALLVSSFQQARPKLMKDLKTAMAYVYLTNATDSSVALKPIEKLRNREQLLKQNLEIWPAEVAESWVDEIGTHQFIGESLCQQQ